MFDLLIRGAMVVTARGRRVADIAVQGETVAQIGELSAQSAAREIDAQGLYVLPGGVDPHVHLSFGDLPMDGEVGWCDDYEIGSRGAFMGGVTTVGNMTFLNAGESLPDGLRREERRIAREAMADVFVHMVLQEPDERSIDALQTIFDAGQPSLKLFMSMPDFDHHFATYCRAMELTGRAGAMTLMHCEDAGCISCCTRLLCLVGADSTRHYAASRPPEAEIRALDRALGMCELTRAPLYVVHLSTAAGLDACRAARSRGLPVFVETRPMYLHLTHDAYGGGSPGLYVGQPPLRSPFDREALWAGMADGSIDTLGSDHAPYTRHMKLAAEHTLREIRPGVADLETMLPMLMSEGARKRGLSLERIVALTAENPARLFGLFPRKGTIAVGSDADLVVWDLDCVREVQGERMQSRAGYSVYDGVEVTGWPRWTIRRGEVVMSDGALHAAPGSGRLLARERHGRTPSLVPRQDCSPVPQPPYRSGG